MKLIMKDKWFLLGYAKDIKMYIFANKNVYNKFGELEISCLSSAKYVDSEQNTVQYLSTSKISVPSSKVFDSLNNILALEM